jgi:MraZ protein
MFLGRFSYTVDAKGRLAVPARFRPELAGEVVLTRGIDPCLALYPMASWQPLAAKVDALSIADPDTRAFRRLVFAEAVNLELDGQGRILLPSDLRDYAGIVREAMVVGVNTSVEIWNPENWRMHAESAVRDGSELASRLASLI